MKGSLLLGTARKKLGDVVFYRSNGEQQARVRVTPKNPQSSRQAAVRAIMATVAIAYSWLQDICDHSFQGVEYGQKSMRRFLALNQRKFLGLYKSTTLYDRNGIDPASVLGFNPKDSKDFVPNSYIVSDGTLPGVTEGRIELPEQPTSKQGISLAEFILLPRGWEGVAENERTWRKLAELLGVPVGAELTFIANSFLHQEGEGESFYSDLNYGRLILTDARGKVDSVIQLTNVSPLNKYVELHKASGEAGGILVDIRIANMPICATGVIVSQKVGDTWKRSRCELYANSQPNASNLLLTSQSYMKSQPNTVNPYWLNKADAVGGASILERSVAGPEAVNESEVIKKGKSK